jgi:hypothetical protein
LIGLPYFYKFYLKLNDYDHVIIKILELYIYWQELDLE